MIEGSDGDTIQGIAEHLARESGRTLTECWADALTIFRTKFERRVLTLDAGGRVVDLGETE